MKTHNNFKIATKNFVSMTRTIQNRALISITSLLVAAMFLLAASGILSAQDEQTYEQLAAAHPGWVQVPGQLIRPDCVHEIPKGARVETSEDGQVTGDVTLNGQVIAHYDACPEAPISTRHSASTSQTPGEPPGPPFSGWVEDSEEYLSWLGSSDNIDLESGYFYVPNNPRVNGGLIYIFNGIVPTDRSWILQPVLQYGYSPAGGGYYWGIASWLVGSGGAFHSPLERVNPGDKLYGYTEQKCASGGTLCYDVVAHDLTTGAYSGIGFQPSGLHWTRAYEGVLEVYYVNSCSQLPSSSYNYFFSNSVDHGFPSYFKVSPAFWGAVYQSGCGDSVSVNNSGDYAILVF